MRKSIWFIIFLILLSGNAFAKDSIQIIISRDCNDDGSGGSIAENVKAVLPNGQLDTLLDAFQSAYGLYKVDDGNGGMVDVSKERNYTVRLKKFSEEVLSSYVIEHQKKSAIDYAKESVDQEISEIVIV